ncbi:hypothetical protein BK133_05095 [Paenibacillus sp. FSL H8-0548]|uniref:hypothetical protein n=1 Tax=Paenibacillus sp. FSL H8-0548 TaxID=1920422 RepID=UPI00096F8C8C|nr:hypothetical protein [Paenibacillus sp. FSL H8-0548]OMF37433.1 hypothetical protein BK133_05095 [Paenibacillus sp. FSL H8-0548]
MEQEQMNLIMGIGPELQFSADIKKTIRVGTVKQIKEVNELHNDGLIKIKYSLAIGTPEEKEVATAKWVEILNIICIEGFDKEEFEDSIPELMESAVERFLLGQQGAG